MLPQMMPLPWLMVFFMVFFCFFSVCLLMSSSHLNFSSVVTKSVKKHLLAMPW